MMLWDAELHNVYALTNNKDHTRDQTFTYDQLNRLTSAQNTGTDCTVILPDTNSKFWGNSYSYDAWGNLLTKNVTKCGAELLSVVAQPNNQLQGFGYDAAGNMVSSPAPNQATSTFDAENRMTTSNFGGAIANYMYDGDGNRVEKSNGTTGTLYWYMTPGVVAESDLNGNLQSEYVFFNGTRIARKDFPSNAVSYYFSDHLNTTDIVTDAQGNIKNESDYYPWGGELHFVANDSNHYKFTGKERDDNETGLDYFGARYYSNQLGRFITPDYLGYGLDPVPVPWADLKNPQSLNLYDYVRNNPTSFDDADGHDCVVQTRTGEKTERVSVSLGNCDHVKVGDGQTKTYVPGVVELSTVKLDGQGGITYSYTPYGGSTGVGYALMAPIPQDTNTAYYYGNNAEAYRTLTQASMTANRIAAATAVVTGVAGCAAYCSAVGTALLNSQAAAQASANAQVLRIMAFLESKGIPATAAAAMALRAMSRTGTQPPLKDKIQFGRELVQKLNQMVREYNQSQGAR